LSQHYRNKHLHRNQFAIHRHNKRNLSYRIVPYAATDTRFASHRTPNRARTSHIIMRHAHQAMAHFAPCATRKLSTVSIILQFSRWMSWEEPRGSVMPDRRWGRKGRRCGAAGQFLLSHSDHLPRLANFALVSYSLPFFFSSWWILGLALQRKQPFQTFCYYFAPLAPLKGSSSPLASSFQAASMGVLEQTKKHFFWCGPLALYIGAKASAPKKIHQQLSLLHLPLKQWPGFS